MIQIGEGDARLPQTITDGLDREARGVFHAVEAFLFHRGHQLAIAHQRRRSIAVIRIDTQNVHAKGFSLVDSSKGCRTGRRSGLRMGDFARNFYLVYMLPDPLVEYK